MTGGESGGESCAERSETLSYEELNGLRYAVGYVPRAIRKKVTKSGHPLREDLLCACHSSKKWMML